MSPNSIRAGDRVKPFQHATVIGHEVSRDLKMLGILVGDELEAFGSECIVLGVQVGQKER